MNIVWKYKKGKVLKMPIQIHVPAVFDGVLKLAQKNSVKKSYRRGRHSHLVEQMDAFTPCSSQATEEHGPSRCKERPFNGMGVATHAEV